MLLFILYHIGTPSVTHPPPSVAITIINEQKMVATIKTVLDKNYTTLKNASKYGLPMISAQLFSTGIITREAKENMNFDEIMHEVRAHLDLLDEVQEIKTFCDQFLIAMASEGGPASPAAGKLAQQWTKQLKDNLDMEIEFDC